MTITTTPRRPAGEAERAGFGRTVWAEWTKFWTVRGWPIGLLLAAAFTVLFTFLVANGEHTGYCTGSGSCQDGHPFVPTGPDGAAVADSYQFMSRPLMGNGTITARITSFTGRIWSGPTNMAPSLARTRPGLAQWAKAGILVTPSTTQGSAYAAVMATGNHGVRFQYNYTHDRAGPSDAVSASSPRWLRLTRTRDTLTGYESTDGTTWTEIGTTDLAGLPATVRLGLFVTSPVSFHGSDSGAATQATATFDHIAIQGNTTDTWRSRGIGSSPHDYYPTLGTGGSHRSSTAVALTGSGDIAPAVAALAGGDTASDTLQFGLIVALIVLIVIATMFITVEYRRSLIRTTFTATPHRGRVLAAKAIVIGAVAFIAGAVSAALAIPLAAHVLTSSGNYVLPTSALSTVRVIAGTGALAAVTAIAVLALGTILRRSAGAIAAGVVVFVLPNLVGPGVLGPGASGSAATWLYRLTPAAGFSTLDALPRSALVDYPYTLVNGYFPLSPWAGLAVLCAYAAVTLALAAFLLHRRDA